MNWFFILLIVLINIIFWYLILHSHPIDEETKKNIKIIEARIERLKNFANMDDYDLMYSDRLISDKFKKDHPDYSDKDFIYRGTIK